MPYDEGMHQSALIDSLTGGMPEPDQTVKGGIPVDGRVEITYDPGGSVANMILFAPRNGGRPITLDKVITELSFHGIVSGIDDFEITDAIKQSVYETPVCVARATLPKRGENGYVTFRYDKEHKLTPVRDEFGIANYRELNSIVTIHKGDIIADITLPTEGVPGENIFGKSIPAQAGLAAKVTVGKNTAITPDGKSIVAECDGHIFYGTGCFVVEDTVTIKSDLDLSVGNIKFFGDVHIRGNVMEGFVVNAGKNVRIDGSVFGGSITAGGDLTIVGGAFSAKIECGGNVDIGFCESSEITANGNVESKQFAFCEVFCYGALTAKGSRGVIKGGKITSMHDITAGIIGSEQYTQTEINIGDGSVVYSRKLQAETELADSNEAYDLAVHNLEFLKDCRSHQGGLLTDAQQRQMKIETQSKLFHAMRKLELARMIEQLDDEIKNKDTLYAKCIGTIYPGAHFCINFLTLEITEKIEHSTITIVDNKLTVVPN